MKRKVFMILSAFAIAFTFTFGAALSVHAANITFNVGSLSEAVMTAALQDLNARKPDWIEYDYVVFQTSATQFGILLYNKAEFDNYIRFDNTVDGNDWDLDRVAIIAGASTAYPRYNYYYLISNGSYVSNASYTSNVDYTFSTTYYMYYTNMPLIERTWDPEYFPTIIVNNTQTTGFKGLYPIDPNWLLNSGVDPDYLWWQINMDVDYQILDEEKNQTDLLESMGDVLKVQFCALFGTWVGGDCADVNDQLQDYFATEGNPVTFWIDLIKACGTLITGLVDWGYTTVTAGVAAITGVFDNTLDFVASIKTLFGYLPDPVDNIANVGLDISAGVGLLHLARLVFLKV